MIMILWLMMIMVINCDDDGVDRGVEGDDNYDDDIESYY